MVNCSTKADENGRKTGLVLQRLSDSLIYEWDRQGIGTALGHFADVPSNVPCAQHEAHDVEAYT